MISMQCVDVQYTNAQFTAIEDSTFAAVYHTVQYSTVRYSMVCCSTTMIFGYWLRWYLVGCMQGSLGQRTTAMEWLGSCQVS
jgi:ABC-type spermidine/putrescine transport system permease subunit I